MYTLKPIRTELNQFTLLNTYAGIRYTKLDDIRLSVPFDSQTTRYVYFMSSGEIIFNKDLAWMLRWNILACAVSNTQ